MSGWNIIYGLINFLILAGGLYLVGRKIVAKLFKGHRQEVSDALEGADAAEVKAGELQRELPLRRAKDDEAIEALRREGEAAARAKRDETLAEARESLEALRQSAAEDEEQARRALRRELNAKSARKICEEAARILSGPENEQARRALDERFVRRMEESLCLTDADRMRLLDGTRLPVHVSAARAPEGALLERLLRAVEKAGLEEPELELTLNESLIDAAVTRVLTAKYQLGLLGE